MYIVSLYQKRNIVKIKKDYLISWLKKYKLDYYVYYVKIKVLRILNHKKLFKII